MSKDAKLLLWAKFSSFPSCQRKYKIKKIIRCRKVRAKMAKEMKSNLQNKHVAANWCWQGSGAGLEAKLLLCAEFLPFSSCHKKYPIEKFIRCGKINMSENGKGN